MAVQIVATDEGIYLARVAFRRPEDHKVMVAFADKLMWHGGVEDVEHFAAEVAAALQDAIEWTIS